VFNHLIFKKFSTQEKQLVIGVMRCLNLQPQLASWYQLASLQINLQRKLGKSTKLRTN
jgi:hypothetical protein